MYFSLSLQDKKNKDLLLSLGTLALIFIGYSLFAHFSSYKASAQSLEGISTGNDVFIRMEEKNPIAGDSISLEAVSYLYNIDTMYLEWYVNGKIIESGIGAKYVSYIIPKGSVKTYVVLRIIDKQTNEKIETNLLIDSEKLIMVWQIENPIVPPFYEGKPLGTQESSITYSILPSNLLENAEYYWSLDYKKQLRESGANKSQFTKSYSLLDDSSIVDIEKNIDGNSRGSLRFTQEFETPFMAWYPILEEGVIDIWNGYVSSIPVLNQSFKIFGVPYNISVPNQNSLDYVYKLDNITLPSKKSDKNILEFETTNGGGRATLDIHLEHPDLIHQEINQKTLLNF